ncbi:ABC transporter substrate-binding protein [Nonomuraea sp. NPDC046802]|uniref:ABC transporter substrate-binding protein n=1 Tax=Nonomuraea sp. NPDC046802 TaxID=3154919 RepID=UPI0033F46EEB
MTRKRHGLAALAAAALLASACGNVIDAQNQAKSGSDHGGEGKLLRVAIFGGSWEKGIRQSVITPFEKETGIRVQAEIGTSTVTLGKLRQSPDAVDVALLDSGVSETARAEKLVATLPQDKIPALPELADRAKLRDREGIWALTMGYWALGLAYNSEKVKTPPTSWDDLWAPANAGKVAIPAPATTGGLPLALLAAGHAEAKGDTDLAPGLTKLRDLNAVSFFDSSGAASNLLQSGEAAVAAHYNSGAWPLADQGLPIKWVAPKEGALAADSRWHVTAKARNVEAAYKFLDFASRKQAQEGLVKTIYLAPANTTAVIPETVRGRMPYGPDGSLDDLLYVDWEMINKNKSKWTDAWTRTVPR